MPKSNIEEQRAFLVSLAHSPILADTNTATYAIQVADHIMTNILKINDQNRKTGEFKVLPIVL